MDQNTVAAISVGGWYLIGALGMCFSGYIHYHHDRKVIRLKHIVGSIFMSAVGPIAFIFILLFFLIEKVDWDKPILGRPGYRGDHRED